MVNIDYIMKLIDWNNSLEDQIKGIKLAKSVKCINVFLQPCDNKNNKNVWDNCAKIIAERPDEELKPYLYELFKWLIDLNWPGAYCIFNRLKEYQYTEWFGFTFQKCIDEARLLNEYSWFETLIELGRFHKLEDKNKYDIDYIMNLLNGDNDEDEQNKGIQLAKNVNDISIFFRPFESKALCKNCAKVIASKKDQDLKPYLVLMFKWIKDLNWPGAEIIYNRLKAMPKQFVDLDYKACLLMAENTKDYSWKSVLDHFKND